MSTTASTTPQTSGAGNLTQKAPPPSNKPPGSKERPPLSPTSLEPSFSSLRDWLIGKEVSIYSPPGHLLTIAYAEINDGKSPGIFLGKILDLTLDPPSGEPLFVLLEYKQKNARRYYQRDVLPVRGCAISVSLEREEVEGDVEP